MGRKKKPENGDLPPNLYRRKGIFYYRDTRTGKEYSLGKNKSQAITETLHANLTTYKPKTSLIERINNVHVITLHEWLDTYQIILEKRDIKKKTLLDYYLKIKLLKRNIIDTPIKQITTKEISDFINTYESLSMAKMLRLTLLDAFNEAIASGVVDTNPVSITKSPKTKVQRPRLTLEQFNYAVNKASDKYSNIFLFALLVGQRIGDIVKMKWSDIKDGRLLVNQSKTGAKVAIPVTLKLDVIGLSIEQVICRLKNNSDRICNVSSNTLRRKFKEALPELKDSPTFHEIRSLSARMFDEEKKSDFSQKLLGHKSRAMTEKYLDSRNNEYVEL